MKLIDIREKNRKRNRRFSLTLFLATIVFLILIVALSLAVLAIYLLIKFGVIVSTDGKVDLGNVLMFMSLISSATAVPIARMRRGWKTLCYATRWPRWANVSAISSSSAFIIIKRRWRSLRRLASRRPKCRALKRELWSI